MTRPLPTHVPAMCLALTLLAGCATGERPVQSYDGPARPDDQVALVQLERAGDLSFVENLLVTGVDGRAVTTTRGGLLALTPGPHELMTSVDRKDRISLFGRSYVQRQRVPVDVAAGGFYRLCLGDRGPWLQAAGRHDAGPMARGLTACGTEPPPAAR